MRCLSDVEIPCQSCVQLARLSKLSTRICSHVLLSYRQLGGPHLQAEATFES